MIKEIDIFGIFVPPLFIYTAMASGLWLIVRSLLTALGIYRWVWHPPLFNTALFVLIITGLVATTFR